MPRDIYHFPILVVGYLYFLVIVAWFTSNYFRADKIAILFVVAVFPHQFHAATALVTDEAILHHCLHSMRGPVGAMQNPKHISFGFIEISFLCPLIKLGFVLLELITLHVPVDEESNGQQIVQT